MPKLKLATEVAAIVARPECDACARAIDRLVHSWGDLGRRNAMWGYLITAGVALVGALVAMALVGFFLPVEHVATGNAQFAVEPERLYDLAVELQNASGIEATETVAERPLRRVTQIVEKPGAAFGGTWTLEFQRLGEGTLLTITERGKVYNPLFRFLSRFTFGHTATIESFLKTLAGRITQGEG
ncbi:MAG: hypothetical protein ACKV0T_22280 [Planctomycetales bacterium]